MRGTTLGEMKLMLRRELKLAESSALAKNVVESHAYTLRSTQERLWRANEWMHMTIRRDVQMQAGERYYAFPADIDLESAVAPYVKWGNQFVPVSFGIRPEHYNQLNSDADQRNDPVVSWDLHRDDVDDGDMLEVWPVPASNAPFLRFWGTQRLRPLIADGDVCDLDDLLIVYYAAVELCPEKDRQAKLTKAISHERSIKARLSKTSVVDLTGGKAGTVPRRREIIVTHVTATS